MGVDISKAQALYKEQKYREAIVILNEVIGHVPDDADLFEFRAMCYFHAQNYEQALVDFNSAQKLEPNNPFRYSSRAYAKSALKDTDGAIEDYQKAIHLDPDDAVAHNNLGLLLEQKGYNQQAKQNFEKADGLTKENDSVSKSVVPNSEPTEEHQSVGSVVRSVFNTKASMKEFLKFIRNGFKLKE